MPGQQVYSSSFLLDVAWTKSHSEFDEYFAEIKNVKDFIFLSF